MDDLAYTLRVLCQRNRDGSHATQADRLRSLTLASRQLREAGFRQMRAGSLKGKHVQVLLRRRQDEGLSAGTLKNRVAHLRWWAEKVGKAGLIPADNACLAIPDRRFVTNEDKARELGDSLARIGDPYVRASLALQQVFGLRREEAIKFQPSYADQGDRIMLKGSWTKGGRSREVPITTPEQRAVLDQAHRIAVFAIPTAANTSAGGVRRPIGSRIGRNPCESFQTRCLRGHRPARVPRLTVTRDSRAAAKRGIC